MSGDIDALVQLLRDTDSGTPPPPETEEENVRSRDGYAVEDTPSSKTSTKGTFLLRTGPSTTDRTSPAGITPGWEVIKFARACGYAPERRLSKPELVTWRLRLEIERGQRTPYPVRHAVLPDGVSVPSRWAFNGFVYLLACRWLHTPGEPAPFAHEFAAAWCGNITPRQAKDARRELVRVNALVQAGVHGRLKLWLPG